MLFYALYLSEINYQIPCCLFNVITFRNEAAYIYLQGFQTNLGLLCHVNRLSTMSFAVSLRWRFNNESTATCDDNIYITLIL